MSMYLNSQRECVLSSASTVFSLTRSFSVSRFQSLFIRSLRSHLYCQIIHGPNNDHFRAYRAALDSTTHQWPINSNRRRHEGNKVKWRKRTTTKEEEEEKIKIKIFSQVTTETNESRNSVEYLFSLLFAFWPKNCEWVFVSFDFDTMREQKKSKAKKRKNVVSERASERAK